MRRVVVLVAVLMLASTAAEGQSPCPAPSPAIAFGPGTYIVGTDIAPGTYRARNEAGEYCSWWRLSGFGGTADEVIAFDASHAQMIVTIAPTDVGFDAGGGCGTWTLVAA